MVISPIALFWQLCQLRNFQTSHLGFKKNYYYGILLTLIPQRNLFLWYFAYSSSHMNIKNWRCWPMEFTGQKSQPWSCCEVNWVGLSYTELLQAARQSTHIVAKAAAADSDKTIRSPPNPRRRRQPDPGTQRLWRAWAEPMPAPQTRSS